MSEESQLDEMRAAIRGDFERLERRRGAQQLMRAVPPPEPRRELDDEDGVARVEPSSRIWLGRLLGR
ncbi:MAG TPA: hypothetical protein VMN35_00985 [Gaiellaceae bacterium]|nr:hypothetical protein [Gaiellaceae bacterium]